VLHEIRPFHQLVGKESEELTSVGAILHGLRVVLTSRKINLYVVQNFAVGTIF